MPNELPDNPLNEQHLARINDALATIDAARRHITLAKAAGIDVSASEHSLNESEARLRAIKQVYFPGR